MTLFICKSCPKNSKQDCGPFDDESNLFMQIMEFHKDCSNWVVFVPDPTTAEKYHDQDWVPQKEKAIKQAEIILKNQSKVIPSKTNTHTDIAELIMQNNHFATLEDTEVILYYSNGAYHDGGEKQIQEICENLILNCDRNIVNEITATIKRKTYKPREFFDRDDFEICLSNVILNVRTGETRQHSPKEYFRAQIPVAFIPGATCPKFIRFLKQCLPNQDDYIDKLEAFASGLLRGSPKLEAMFFDTGKGDNGKSTFYKIINWFYGPDNVSTVSIHELIHNKFAKARLENKRVNTFPDIESDALDNFGILKALVSGDAIDAEFKYQNPYTFVCHAKLFFSANELPEIKEKTFATTKRIRLTKWNQEFVKGSSYELKKDILRIKLPDFTDEDLENELSLNGTHRMNRQFIQSILNDESEKSGILNLLLIVVQHIIKRDGFFNDYTHEQVTELWTENSTMIETFIKDCIVKDHSKWIPKHQVYQAYYSYCKASGKPAKQDNVVHPVIQTTLGIEHSQKRIKGKVVRVYEGLAWNLDNIIIRRLRYSNVTGESGFRHNRPTLSTPQSKEGFSDD